MMNRKKIEEHILSVYGTQAEYPWSSMPDHAVFRHGNNKKWFAVIMNLPKEKIGVYESGNIEVMNLKCDPMLIGDLRCEKGFFPAYHMNKTYWITVVLDGTVEENKIKWLLDLSFDLTALKVKKR